jgi:hypothetical protein
MLSRANAIVNRQQGEYETDDVRIHDVRHTENDDHDGFCKACGNWTRNLVKVAKTSVCYDCRDIAIERLNQRA